MKNNTSRPARILVIYHSESGHTKMMAKLVAQGAASVPDVKVRLKAVAKATADDLVWCDGVAVGSPTHMGTIAWEMKRWWDVVARPLWPKIEGKIGCAFSSSGGLAGGGDGISGGAGAAGVAAAASTGGPRGVAAGGGSAATSAAGSARTRSWSGT